jgi:hypothetical protein
MVVQIPNDLIELCCVNSLFNDAVHHQSLVPSFPINTKLSNFNTFLLKWSRNIIGIDLSVCCNAVNDAWLQIIVQICPQLERLNVNFCKKITDTGLKDLASGCSQIQSLYLNGCSKITDEGFQYIANKCYQLKKLNLWSCNITDKGLQALVNECHQLQELDLSWTNITYVGFKEIAKCLNLKQLTLRNCEQITDAWLLLLAIECQQLQELDLGCCQHITDIGLQYLAEHSYSLNLRMLDLFGCNGVTDVGIQILEVAIPYINIIHK